VFFTRAKLGPRIVRPIVEMALDGIRSARPRQRESEDEVD
jgi:hypothetical protein